MTSAADLDADLAETWETLVAWLRQFDEETLDQPSGLPGWRLRDLVAHLGLAMEVITTAEPAPIDAEPDHTLRTYLASYPDRAAPIRDGAAERAAQVDDVVAAADAAGSLALRHLANLRREGIELVLVRRGVVALTTLLMSRLVELVVHGDDLARQVRLPTPVDPTARTTVAEAFLEILSRRSGHDLRVADERTWIRLAAGRIGWAERGDALQPGIASEGLPDLRGYLPVL